MDNQTMIQFFEWNLPADQLHWQRCAAQAGNLKALGFTSVWLPPAYKGAGGAQDVGYGVYDVYDLGEFEQKGSVPTKYGTRAEYLAAVEAMQAAGLQVLTDIVLNHKIGADAWESVEAVQDDQNDRNRQVADPRTIEAWTVFNFPGRKGKYSNFTWNASHFDGTDWDNDQKYSAIFKLQGKDWDGETDTEHGNYDYLMGADLDMSNPEVMAELEHWGKWYYDTVHMDGFRLDAVKHIRFSFYADWLQKIRAYAGKELFTVGEYWSPEVGRLQHYLDVCGRCMSLFDVPLHFRLSQASSSGGAFDMRQMFDQTLVCTEPDYAVTFVDNHDTQPGQALASWVQEWFRPLAYAMILLRTGGYPCVFYGDLYGIPHDHIPPVAGLVEMLAVRQRYAYGEQHDYFDHPDVVGWTREGDSVHADSGCAVLLSDGSGGEKTMLVGKQFAGETFYDCTGHCEDTVAVDADGNGKFLVGGGSVSVWLREKAYQTVAVEF